MGFWGIDGAAIAALTGHALEGGDVRVSPDGQTLASASSDRRVRL